MEAQRVGGLLAPLGAGEGKTDICSLLPEIMDSRVAVLLVPAALRKKFLEIDYPLLSGQYRLPNVFGHGLYYADTKRLLYVISYEELSRHTATDLLPRRAPDLIVADEAHRLQNSSAAVTKRVTRYLNENRHVRFCGLSGSITTKSIKNFAHLSKFALRDGSPLPLNWLTLEEWASALDPGEMPAPAGELLVFCEPGEDVRSGFRRRLVETPGVVASVGNRLPVALNIHSRPLATTPAIERALGEMRDSWVTAGGEVIPDQLAFSRYARQLAGGFYTRWIWPRGEPLDVRLEWLEARAEWHKEVRSFLKTRAREGMDSPFLLARAAQLGDWPSATWGRWAGIKGEAEPATEVVWVDDYLVRDALAWGERNVGIIWYEHDAIGRRLADLSGFPFYGPGEQAGLSLQRESGRRTVIASVKAHGEGKNLQQFRSQLVTTPSSNGKTWEQLLARMHRQGQKADEVDTFVYLHTTEMAGALTSAIRDARYFEETVGATQRLCYATFTFTQSNPNNVGKEAP